MRSPVRSALILTALLSIGATGAQAQATFAFTLSAGPLFSGVSFGVGGPVHDHASVSFGSSFGYANPHYSGYGVYSSPNHYSASCYDPYWYSYDHCVVTASYYPTFMGGYDRWGADYGHYGWNRPRYAYVADPFYDPWGPYWAYDPWGSYWDGYWDGYGSGSYWNGYGYRGRSHYFTGHRYASRGYYVARPYDSRTVVPYYAGNARFKENPSRHSTVASGRRAQPRPTAQPAAAQPRASVASSPRPGATTDRRGSTTAARGRGASVNRRAPRVGTAATGSSSRAPATNTAARAGRTRATAQTSGATGRTARVPTVGRRPIAAEWTTRGGPISRPGASRTRTSRGSGSAPAAAGSSRSGTVGGGDARRTRPSTTTRGAAATTRRSGERSARTRPSAPQTRAVPNHTSSRPSASSRPSGRSTPQRGATRSTGTTRSSGRSQATSRSPSVRLTPRVRNRPQTSRPTATRAAPSRGSARPAPTRGGASARPAPTRAPQARSAPARSGRSTPSRSRTPRRRN